MTSGVDGALERVLWIGGAQWAGKTTVAQLLAARHGLILYAYDYHDARSHSDRALAQPERYPQRHAWLRQLAANPDSVWVNPTPEKMAADALASFAERFEMVLEDLAALPGTSPVVAEGWGLRPDLVAGVIDDPRRAVFLVPSEAFREEQLKTLARAGRFGTPGVSDVERGQRNRLERDRLLAADVIESAGRLGMRVIEVDGSIGAGRIAALVSEQFKPFLPSWLY